MSVRYGLLGLIAQRPRHGYELLSAFTAIVGGDENWEVKPAQVYATLSRLQEAGLIEEDKVWQEGGPEKRNFVITAAGLEELRVWLAEPVASEHRRDEFFVKFMIALLTREEDPQKLIYRQRSMLLKELHGIQSRRILIDRKVNLAHDLLLGQAVMHTEADLRWIEMVEARLDEIRRQPIPEPEPKVRGRPRKSSQP